MVRIAPEGSHNRSISNIVTAEYCEMMNCEREAVWKCPHCHKWTCMEHSPSIGYRLASTGEVRLRDPLPTQYKDCFMYMKLKRQGKI